MAPIHQAPLTKHVHVQIIIYLIRATQSCYQPGSFTLYTMKGSGKAVWWTKLIVCSCVPRAWAAKYAIFSFSWKFIFFDSEFAGIAPVQLYSPPINGLFWGSWGEEWTILAIRGVGAKVERQRLRDVVERIPALAGVGVGRWWREDELVDLKLCKSMQRLDVRLGETVRLSQFRTRLWEGDSGQSRALVCRQGLQASGIATIIVLIIKHLHAHHVPDICRSALRAFMGCLAPAPQSTPVKKHMKVMYEEASPGEACEGMRKWNGAGREQTQAQTQARGSVFLFPSGL